MCPPAADCSHTPAAPPPAGALKPHCDLLLCETLATVTEGLAAATASAASGLPWWISWTLEDSERVLLRSGEPLQARHLGRWTLAAAHCGCGGDTERRQS